jgi:histone H4
MEARGAAHRVLDSEGITNVELDKILAPLRTRIAALAPAVLGKPRVLMRYRKVLRDNIQAIRRLACRGGVKRIYEETRGVLKVFLEKLIHDTLVYTEHGRCKTVTAMDVVYALKRQGRPLYGF